MEETDLVKERRGEGGGGGNPGKLSAASSEAPAAAVAVSVGSGIRSGSGPGTQMEAHPNLQLRRNVDWRRSPPGGSFLPPAGAAAGDTERQRTAQAEKERDLTERENT